MNSIITQGYGNVTLIPTQGYGGGLFDSASGGPRKGRPISRSTILGIYSPVEMMGSESLDIFASVRKSLDKSIQLNNPVAFTAERSLNLHTRVSSEKLRRIIKNL